MLSHNDNFGARAGETLRYSRSKSTETSGNERNSPAEIIRVGTPGDAAA